MYAIIEVGGRQWKVEPGTRLQINRLQTAVGGELVVDRVLFAYDGREPQVGKPFISGAKVVCEVTEHLLGPKTIAYHFRRRENWRKTRGHRQTLTNLVVRSISCGGVNVGEKEKAEAQPARKAAEPKASAASKVAAVESKPSAAKATRASVIKPQLKSLTKKPTIRRPSRED